MRTLTVLHLGIFSKIFIPAVMANQNAVNSTVPPSTQEYGGGM